MNQSAEEIRAAVNAVADEERRKFAPGTDQAETPKENGAPLPFPSRIMTGAAGYFSSVMGDCMEPPRHFFFMAYMTCLGAILSKIMSGAVWVRRGDERVLMVAKVLELNPEDCFEEDTENCGGWINGRTEHGN